MWRRYGGTGARRWLIEACPVAGGAPDPATLARDGWMHVADVDAMQFEEYGYIVPGFGDSTEAGIIWTDCMVLAHSTALGEYWASEPISGYTVDNLAPAAPMALAADLSGTDVALTWSPSRYNDEDLSFYKVYRSEVEGFAPEEAAFVGTADDTIYVDEDPGPTVWYYLVSGEDVHGNEGPPSNEATVTLGTGVDEPLVPQVLAIRGNHPNPFNPSTIITYDLPRTADVRLEIYSATGRLVAVAVDGETPAGRHHVTWLGRDSSGNALSSGVYFARLVVGESAVEHKMVLLK